MPGPTLLRTVAPGVGDGWQPGGGGVLPAWGGCPAAALGVLLAVQPRPPSLQAPSTQALGWLLQRPVPAAADRSQGRPCPAGNAAS